MFKKMSVTVEKRLRERLSPEKSTCPPIEGFMAAMQLPGEIVRYYISAAPPSSVPLAVLTGRSDILGSAIDRASRVQSTIRDTVSGERVLLELRFFERNRNKPFEILRYEFTQQGRFYHLSRVPIPA